MTDNTILKVSNPFHSSQEVLMLTDLGPGILPYQYALIQMPPSPTLHLLYWQSNMLRASASS